MDYTDEEKKKREEEKQKLMEQFKTLKEVKAEQLRVQKQLKEKMSNTNWESDETDVDALQDRLALLQEIEQEYKTKKLKNKVKKSLQEARFGVESEES